MTPAVWFILGTLSGMAFTCLTVAAYRLSRKPAQPEAHGEFYVQDSQ